MATIYTEHLGAVILYASGNCCRVRPWHHGMVSYLDDGGPPDPWGDPEDEK